MVHNWGKWKYETSHSCHLIRTCYRCGDVDSGRYIHKWSELHYESEKSCKAEVECLRCGKIKKSKKFHHQWNSWHYRESQKCETYRVCSRCEQTESDVAHQWGNWEYKSESECSHIRICKRCGSKEIGLEKHAWGKIRFLKSICKRCNKKRKIKNYIIPNWWHSKRGRGINTNSKKFKVKESRRLEIVKIILEEEELEWHREQEIQEQERKSDQERIKRHQSISKSFIKSMGFLRENLFLDSLIIDSNIWMDDRPQYHDFLSVFRFLLMHFNICYTFYGPQFDEICNIKFRTEYGESRNKKSRIAINRIDKLSDENLLRVTPVNIELEYPGHVDPMLIKLLLLDAKKGKRVALLSNDVELRIRAREKLKEHNVSYYRILKMDDIEKHIEIIKLAMKESIAENIHNAQPQAENVIYL